MSDSNVYTAEKILKKRIRNGVTQYFIKWKGYSTRDNTWEPQENILDSSLLESFEEDERSRRNKKQKTSHRNLQNGQQQPILQQQPQQPLQEQQQQPLQEQPQQPLDQHQLSVEEHEHSLDELKPQLVKSPPLDQEPKFFEEESNCKEPKHQLVEESQPLTNGDSSGTLDMESEGTDDQQQQELVEQKQSFLELEQQQQQQLPPQSPSPQQQQPQQPQQQLQLQLQQPQPKQPKPQKQSEGEESPPKQHLQLHKPSHQQQRPSSQQQQKTTQNNRKSSQQPQKSSQQKAQLTPVETSLSKLSHQAVQTLALPATLAPPYQQHIQQQPSFNVKSKRQAVLSTVITDVTVNDLTITISESKTNQGFFREKNNTSVDANLQLDL